MIHVRFSDYFDWPLLRQTPGGRGVWGNCRFSINEPSAECDCWIVYWDLHKPQRGFCAPQNTIFFAPEPASVMGYHPEFLAQFGTVVTAQRGLTHPNIIYSQPAIPWWIGAKYLTRSRDINSHAGTLVATKTYDDFKNQAGPAKERLLSVVSSNKARQEGHVRRTEFVRQLKERMGDGVDIFGRGTRDFGDKWDVIAPYKYHIVVENSVYPDYWTEKLADCFLGDAHPFYYGCSNVDEYFPSDALTRIDIGDIEASVDTIQRTIQAGTWELSCAARQEAKARVLKTYNLFAAAAQICESLPIQASKRFMTLKPHDYFWTPGWRRAARAVKHGLKNLVAGHR